VLPPAAALRAPLSNPSAVTIHGPWGWSSGVGLVLSRGRQPPLSPVEQIWIVLGARRFAAKTPDHEAWISLDFLGFSRQNLDLSMGYEE